MLDPDRLFLAVEIQMHPLGAGIAIVGRGDVHPAAGRHVGLGLHQQHLRRSVVRDGVRTACCSTSTARSRGLRCAVVVQDRSRRAARTGRVEIGLLRQLQPEVEAVGLGPLELAHALVHGEHRVVQLDALALVPCTHFTFDTKPRFSPGRPASVHSMDSPWVHCGSWRFMMRCGSPRRSSVKPEAISCSRAPSTSWAAMRGRPGSAFWAAMSAPGRRSCGAAAARACPSRRACLRSRRAWRRPW